MSADSLTGNTGTLSRKQTFPFPRVYDVHEPTGDDRGQTWFRSRLVLVPWRPPKA